MIDRESAGFQLDVMSGLVVTRACNLEMIVFREIYDGLGGRFCDAMRSADETLLQKRRIGVLKRTAVIVARSWRIGRYDFHAREGRIIGLLSLLSVRMTDVVSMLFVKMSGSMAFTNS